MICEHCKSRHSWDCDDGCAYPKHGCDNFSLDWDSLSNEQKQIIFDLLDEKEKNMVLGISSKRTIYILKRRSKMSECITWRDQKFHEKEYYTIQTFDECSAKELGESIKQIVGPENVAVFSEGYYPSVRVRATKEEFDYISFKNNLGYPEAVYFY